jgi:hypothetical protein
MPEFIQPTATIRLLPDRAQSKLIKARRNEESGRIIWSEPHAKQETCVLCGIVGGDRHTVMGHHVLAHAACLRPGTSR